MRTQVFSSLALTLFACGGSQPAAPTAATPAPATAETIRIVDGIVSAYLLPIDATHAALVDCGMDPDAKAILDTLASRQLTAESVTAIFVTHRHGDHMGGCERFPNAKLYAFPDGEPDASITAITDGQTLALGSLSITAYSVPGHTPDSVAYLANGVLYLGDAAMLDEDGHTLKASPRRFHGMTHEPDTQKQNVPPLRALHDRLVAARTPIRQLAFGHSAPLDGLDALANPQ